MRIQRVWRRTWGPTRTVRALVARSRAVGATLEHARGLSFDEICVFLRRPDVVVAFGAMLQRIHFMCVLRHGEGPYTVNVRVVLAGLMMVAHPTETFEVLWKKERRLTAAGEALLTMLYEMGAAPSFAMVSPERSAGLLRQLRDYLALFAAWKTEDVPKVVSRVRMGLIALYEMQPHVASEAAAKEIGEQIDRCRQKLSTIGGAAALAGFDEERAGGAVAALLPPPARTSNEEVGLVVPPPPGLLGSYTAEELRHSVAVDPAFRLTPDSDDYLKRVFDTAFWESMIGDLRLEPPCFSRLLLMLGEIRDDLTRPSNVTALGGGGTTTGVGFMDMALIKQQMEEGAFGFEDGRRLLAQVMGLIGPAMRWDAVRKARWAAMDEAARVESGDRPRALCAALEVVVGELNEWRLMEANLRLERVAKAFAVPRMLNEELATERRRFEESVAAGRTTVERTTVWLGESMRGLLEGGARTPSLPHVHVYGLIELITTTVEPAWPETLALDRRGLSAARRRFGYVVNAVTLLRTLASVPQGLEVCEEVAERLAAEEEDMLDRIEDRLDDEGCNEPTLYAARQQLIACLRPTDPVRRVVARRLTEALRMRMVMADGGATMARAVPPVLLPMTNRLVDGLEKVSRINCAVHAPLYQRLLLLPVL